MKEFFAGAASPLGWTDSLRHRRALPGDTAAPDRERRARGRKRRLGGHVARRLIEQAVQEAGPREPRYSIPATRRRSRPVRGALLRQVHAHPRARAVRTAAHMRRWDASRRGRIPTIRRGRATRRLPKDEAGESIERRNTWVRDGALDGAQRLLHGRTDRAAASSSDRADPHRDRPRHPRLAVFGKRQATVAT